MRLGSRAATAAALCVCLVHAGAALADPLEFHVTFDRAVYDRPFTGRVYVMLSSSASVSLPSGPRWFQTEPFFARDVKAWRPGEKLVFGSDALGYPVTIPKLKRGVYTIHAVMDLDRGNRSFSTAEGNLYGKPLRRELDPETTGPVAIKLDQVYRAPAFPEKERVKLVDVESKLLSAFHKRPTRLRAAVVLPASYARSPGKRYPVVYEVPGFGGNHFMALNPQYLKATDVAGVEMLWVVLDPGCRNGHHVFADSANNGPCGRALVEELIPAVERKFRAIGKPGARFVTGHSSGGWSSLWLQVSHPDFFGGVWSTGPDPVDFRDFQRVNLYERGANMFYDAGKPRPLARLKGKPVLWYKGFSDMEEVMGHGGQLASFEAVFSERGPGGKPKKLWDRKSGAVDPAVAKSWKKYDIRLVLERDWKAVGPKLAGKVHVYTGDEDNFYLEGAVRLLKDSLKRLGSDGVVELFPGKDHGTLLDRALRERIAREMAAQFRRARLGE